MAVPPRKEDSVVAALGELRRVENDRQRAELEARLAEERAATAARQRAAHELERRAADDARAAALRAEAEARAERLVAIEIEARARATAELALATEHQAQELALRREQIARTRPTFLIGIAVACAGVAIAFAVVAMQRATAIDDARLDAWEERRRADRLSDRIDELEGQVATVAADLRDARDTVARLTQGAPAPSTTTAGARPGAKPTAGTGKGGGKPGPATEGAKPDDRIDTGDDAVNAPLFGLDPKK